MKITSNALPLQANDNARLAVARFKPRAPAADAPGTSAALSGGQPANVAEAHQKTFAPAGLEKVLARLQSIPQESRSHGQTMAAERINRNIARYLETQAIVAPVSDTGGTEAAPPSDSVDGTPTEPPPTMA